MPIMHLRNLFVYRAHQAYIASSSAHMVSPEKDRAVQFVSIKKQKKNTKISYRLLDEYSQLTRYQNLL